MSYSITLYSFNYLIDELLASRSNYVNRKYSLFTLGNNKLKLKI